MRPSNPRAAAAVGGVQPEVPDPVAPPIPPELPDDPSPPDIPLTPFPDPPPTETPPCDA